MMIDFRIQNAFELYNYESQWEKSKEPYLQFETMKEPRAYIYATKSYSIAKLLIIFCSIK